MEKIRINFFEEFYTISSLIVDCRSIPFPSTVYIASKSIEQFLFLKEKVKKAAPHVQLGFWPVLPKSYWVSPFSSTSELLNLYKTLQNYNGKDKINVLLDLELPLLHPKLFLTNLFSFRQNKKIIENILLLSKINNLQFLSAEYNLPLIGLQNIGELLGIHYSHKRFNYITIFMQYNTSLTRIFNIDLTIAAVKRRAYNEIAIGIIAPGVFHEVNLLSSSALGNKLRKLKENKVKTVTLFSLSGFKGEYKKILTQK